MPLQSLMRGVLLIALAVLFVAGISSCEGGITHFSPQVREPGRVIDTDKEGVKVREVKVWANDDERRRGVSPVILREIWDPVTREWYSARPILDDKNQVTGYEMTPEAKNWWESNVRRMRGGGGNGY